MKPVFMVSWRIRARRGWEQHGTRNTEEGANRPDDDAQFRHINVGVKKAVAAVILGWSAGRKKKKLVGNYTNAGRQWRHVREASRVQGHDFPRADVPRAHPYGICVARNKG